MMNNKFQLGDKVCSKLTGLPAIGHVIVISDPIYHIHTTRSFAPYWTELYPDWETKPTYILLLSKPQCPMTYEEFCKGMPPNISKDKVDMGYALVPWTSCISYPEDDLELFGGD